MLRVKRPWLMMSTVADILASNAGLRYDTEVIIVPRRIFSVTAASAARVVQLSMKGSSASPAPGAICIMWSMMSNQTKPCASAHCALRFRSSKNARFALRKQE